MPTTKHTLKVARATKEEIDKVRDILNEIASLDNYFSHEYYDEAIKDNKDDFPFLSKILTDDRDDFITSLVRLINNISHEKVIFNLDVLMDNCADLSADTLEFNKHITKGLELLDKHQWISVEDELPIPEKNIEVIGYNSEWINEDFNPNGTRICCFIDNEEWTTAKWNDIHDCYISTSKDSPTHWMQILKSPKNN